MFTPLYSKRFLKQIKKFPKREQIKVLDKISITIPDPRKFSIKLESTNPPVYKLRIGEYRVFFELNNEKKTIKITDVLRRTNQTYH